jgi:hypothetical protein
MRLKSQDSSTDARNDKERSVWNSFHRVILSLSKDPMGPPVILSEVRLSLRYAEGSHGSTGLRSWFSVAVRATATAVTVRAGRMRSLISHRPNSAQCCLGNAVFVLRLHCVPLRMTNKEKAGMRCPHLSAFLTPSPQTCGEGKRGANSLENQTVLRFVRGGFFYKCVGARCKKIL